MGDESAKRETKKTIPEVGSSGMRSPLNDAIHDSHAFVIHTVKMRQRLKAPLLVAHRHSSRRPVS